METKGVTVRCNQFSRLRLAVSPLAWMMSSCALLATTPGSEEAASEEAKPEVEVEMSHGVPIARDEVGQAMLRLDVFEADQAVVVVPYLYGYPLYSGKGGYVGVRKLRQENWEGYERREREDDEGRIRVVERFPQLGCRFEGIQEGPHAYVPLELHCDVPPPENLGGKQRSVVGSLKAHARVKRVLGEPSVERAFLGEWHATSPDFDGKNGTGYFATPDGLLGFRFKRGRLQSVSFLFDAPHETWRKPELWAAP